jgi:Rrf2 family transcriptional regulator, iron-sulfur cluster assembly transcription factor
MIKISTRVMYGLRAIIYMGLNYDRLPISLNEIALNQNIPIRYIEQIFIRFKKARIIKSVRGINGGYSFNDNFDSLTLLDIVVAADGSVIPVWCLNPLSKRKCPIVEECMLAEVWRGLAKEIEDYLSSIKLKDLVEKAKETNFVELFRKMRLG